jgi:uncharacterized iron-regulated protein
MKLRQLFILASVMLIAHTSTASDSVIWRSPLLQDHLLVGKIYDYQAKTFISEDQLLNKLFASRLVLIGEQHDNPDHHLIEQELLESLLSEASSQVVFEMIKQDQQTAVDTLSKLDTLNSMKEKIEWNTKGWPWEYYGPLVYTAVQSGAKITAGNLTTATLKTLYQQKNSDGVDADYPSVSRINEQQQDAILNEIYESHCQSMPKEQLKPMLNIQLARDAYMAKALVSGNFKQSILIAGSFHTQKHNAVPQHLTYYTPIEPKVLLLRSVTSELTAPEQYASLNDADYIWFTPKPSDIDYCAQFKTRQ